VGYEPLEKIPLSVLVEMSMRKKGEKEKFDDEGEDEDYVTSPDISSDEEIEGAKEAEIDPACEQLVEISTPPTNQEGEDQKQTSDYTTRPSYGEGISYSTT